MQNSQPNYMPQTENKNRKKSVEMWRFSLVGIALAIAVFLLCLLVKDFVFSNYMVKQSSMEPTLYENDIVWVNKLANPKRGDIVLVVPLDATGKPLRLESGDKLVLIKRVVGLGGDKLWVEQSQESPFKYYLCRQTIDGTTEKLSDEAYDGIVLDKMNSNESFSSVGLPKNQQNQDCIGEENALTVPEGCFYCLGDNRTGSLDSRTYGSFEKASLEGVVVGKGMQWLWIAVGVIAAVLVILFILTFVVKSKTSQPPTAKATVTTNYDSKPTTDSDKPDLNDQTNATETATSKDLSDKTTDDCQSNISDAKDLSNNKDEG